jgi:hypothetical protein
MKIQLLTACILLAFASFGQEKREMKKSNITTCLLVEKAFVKKNGEPTDTKELYLRCSVQDYFIKICESDVTRKDLEEYLDRGIAVTMEIMEGEWDSCPDDKYQVQSRVGTYIIIKSIEK